MIEESELYPLEVVGGHGMKSNEKLCILVSGNCIFKPFQSSQKEGLKSRGEREKNFYMNAKKMNHPICLYIPSFFGVKNIAGKKYLILENLLYNMKKPCIMDIKMGQRTYDKDATLEKINRERRKYPLQEIIGFHIVGMKVMSKMTNNVYKSNRAWCMSITAETMPDSISKFFF